MWVVFPFGCGSLETTSMQIYVNLPTYVPTHIFARLTFLTGTCLLYQNLPGASEIVLEHQNASSQTSSAEDISSPLVSGT